MSILLLLVFSSITLLVLFFFFFFQAEDGIRDLIVTGVQTCALPISGHVEFLRIGRDRRPHERSMARREGLETVLRAAGVELGLAQLGGGPRPPDREIGRASCRERV